MKKTLLYGLLAILFLGMKVQAAPVLNEAPVSRMMATGEQVDVNALMAAVQQKMNTMTVYGMEVWMNNQMTMDVAVDMNTKVFYGVVTVDGTSVTAWGDGNTKMMYMYDSTSGKYYFTPDVADFSQLEKEKNTAMQTVSTDASMTYTYVGKVTKTVKNQATECHQVHAAITQDGITSSCEYYISTSDNRLISLDMSMDTKSLAGMAGGISMQMNLYYPEKLTIPEEAIANATISPGYTVSKGKVTYAVKYVKNQPVFSVSDASKAKKAVKIADSVTVCGKKYLVYEIGASAFYNNKKVTSVSIGKNVQVIGKRAFCNCKKLANVKIQSKNVKTIGKDAFKATKAGMKVKVPAKKLAKYKKLFGKAKASVSLSK